MGLNSGKIKVQSTAKKKTKNSPWSKDILMDPAGQLKYPGQPTRIPGNTMSTDGYGNIPLMVYPDVGPPQMVQPNTGNHNFPGASYFDEYPMMEGGGGVLNLGAGPLREQNPYLIPEYAQPMDGNTILPDMNRPGLPGTDATEYKMSYNTGMPNEIQIPSVVNGQYIGSRALDRYNATGERFKTMNDPSSYSQYYDMISRLGLMKKQGGGELELSDAEVEEYRRGGYVVEELPKAQIGDAGKKAYAEYQDNITSMAPELMGTHFAPDMTGVTSGFGADNDPDEYNCIGSACNFTQSAGADVPIIPGNSSFWDQAERGQIPVHVYANAKNMDYERALDFIKPGDYIGHDTGSQGGAGRNEYFPEHSNIFLRWDTDKAGNKIAVTMDGQTGYEHLYNERNYLYSDLIDPENKRLFLGRPTSVDGQKLEFNYPHSGDNRWYFPPVSDETISNLKPLKWVKNDEFDRFGDLNKDQITRMKGITDVLSSRKPDFIKSTGMSEEDYDSIASIMNGLAYQETKLGKTDPDSSLVQEEKNLLKGDFKDSAVTLYERLKQDVGSVEQFFGKDRATSKGIFQVKEAALFGDPLTREALKRLGITKKNYDPGNIEHNTLASMVWFDNVNKNQGRKFDKIEARNVDDKGVLHHGNKKSLSKAEKLLYYYNNQSVPKSGKAWGESLYNKNVTGFNPVILQNKKTQYAERKLGGQHQGVDLTEEEVKRYKAGGYVVEELPTYQSNINTGEVKDPIAGIYGIPSYDVAADKYTGRDYPFYNELSEEEKGLFRNPSVIGSSIRDKAAYYGKDQPTFSDDLDYIGNTAFNTAAEFTPIPAAIRIAKDPMAHLKATGEAITDVAPYLMAGMNSTGFLDPTLYTDTNPLTGRPKWENIDKALDVAAIVPELGAAAKTLKVGKALKGLKKSYPTAKETANSLAEIRRAYDAGAYRPPAPPQTLADIPTFERPSVLSDDVLSEFLDEGEHLADLRQAADESAFSRLKNSQPSPDRLSEGFNQNIDEFGNTPYDLLNRDEAIRDLPRPLHQELGWRDFETARQNDMMSRLSTESEDYYTRFLNNATPPHILLDNLTVKKNSKLKKVIPNLKKSISNLDDWLGSKINTGTSPTELEEIIKTANKKLDKGLGVLKGSGKIELKTAGKQVGVYIDGKNTGHLTLDKITKDPKSLSNYIFKNKQPITRSSSVPGSNKRTVMGYDTPVGYAKTSDFPFGNLQYTALENMYKGKGYSGEINKAINESLKDYGNRLYSGASGHTQEGMNRYQNLFKKGLVEEMTGPGVPSNIFRYKRKGGEFPEVDLSDQEAAYYKRLGYILESV